MATRTGGMVAKAICTCRLGLGTAGFGAKMFRPVDEGVCRETLETFVCCGGDLIDTARNYGDSERIVGSGVGGQPGLVVCSKSEAQSRDGFKRDLDCSLGLLGKIDVYYMHTDKRVQAQHMVEWFVRAKESGLIGMVGLCGNFEVDGVDVYQIPAWETPVVSGVVIGRSVLGRGKKRGVAATVISDALSRTDLSVVLLGARTPIQIVRGMQLCEQ